VILLHELGIVYEVIRIVDSFAKDNNLSKVSKIVLEIGQLSQAIPRFIEECFPAAVDNTDYANSELQIVVIPAIASCSVCGTEYNVVENRRICPQCGSDKFVLMTGQEFSIKEIVGC